MPYFMVNSISSSVKKKQKQEAHWAHRSPEQQWIYMGIQRILRHMAPR